MHRVKTDFAVIKFKIPELLFKRFCCLQYNGFIPLQDTLRDVCGYDSVIVTYRPVPINGPFDQYPESRYHFCRAKCYSCIQMVMEHIVWNAHSTLSCTNCPDPVASPTATTIYTATNLSPNGCQVSDQFTVVVLNDAVVDVPTAFTPNGDGLNDYFGPMGKVPEGYKLQIFNRNGEIVFKSYVHKSAMEWGI